MGAQGGDYQLVEVCAILVTHRLSRSQPFGSSCKPCKFSFINLSHVRCTKFSTVSALGPSRISAAFASKAVSRRMMLMAMFTFLIAMFGSTAAVPNTASDRGINAALLTDSSVRCVCHDSA